MALLQKLENFKQNKTIFSSSISSVLGQVSNPRPLVKSIFQDQSGPVACTIKVLRSYGMLQIVPSLIDDARVIIYDPSFS
jgi:hypothetical protein